MQESWVSYSGVKLLSPPLPLPLGTDVSLKLPCQFLGSSVPLLGRRR